YGTRPSGRAAGRAGSRASIARLDRGPVAERRSELQPYVHEARLELRSLQHLQLPLIEPRDTIGASLDGGDLTAHVLHGQRQVGADPPTVDEHHAGAGAT